MPVGRGTAPFLCLSGAWSSFLRRSFQADHPSYQAQSNVPCARVVVVVGRRHAYTSPQLRTHAFVLARVQPHAAFLARGKLRWPCLAPFTGDSTIERGSWLDPQKSREAGGWFRSSAALRVRSPRPPCPCPPPHQRDRLPPIEQRH